MNAGSGGSWITIGVVGRAHGRGDAFVVERASERIELFAAGSELYVADRPAGIVSSVRAGGRIVLELDVEVERGDKLRLRRSELPPLADGEYYVADLVGLAVVTDDGEELGAIADVLPLPANDVIELDTGELLPLVRACVLDVDLAAGRVVVARSFASGG